MNKEYITQKAEEYKTSMLAIDSNFPITHEAMALSVWTQMNPMQRYEIMQSIEKMPKSLASKQKVCLSKIVEIIKEGIQ